MKNELTGGEISESKLGRIAELANLMVALESEIALKEIELARLAERLNDLSSKQIPDMMLEIGLRDFRLTSGAKVVVAPFYSAKIPSDREQEAFKWLDETNNSSIVKCEVHATYSRGEIAKAREILAKLMKLKLPFELSQSIHHSTLKAFVRERIENNKPLPRDLFGVFVGNKTTISI